MPRICDIAQAIEEHAPLYLQESYDNAGLQVGDSQSEATAALLCLDVTEDIMDEAIARGCNLVVSHHPIIFRGLKHITGSTPVERIVAKAIKHDIAIYAAHTNMDSALYGVSTHAAFKIGMKNIQVLVPNDKTPTPTTGMGVVGDIKPEDALHLLKRVKKIFGVGAITYSGLNEPITITRVAFCGGSAIEIAPEAIAAGAQIFITGDVKYHEFTTLCDRIIVANIGHFESEHFTKEIFYDIIQKKFPNFATYYAEKEKNPINYL